MTDRAEPKRKLAGDNPWYVLMTLAGEQPAGGRNKELRVRNRRFWNGWAVAGLKTADKDRLIGGGWARPTAFDPGGPLAPWTDEERAEAERLYHARLPDALPMPDPPHPIHFLETAFATKLHCARLIFPRWTNFEDAAFSGRADFECSTFLAGVEFAGARFYGRAFLRDAAFSGRAGFMAAEFSRGASFEQAAFNGSANFTDAAFSGETSFRGALFCDEASFSGAAFSGEAIFRDAAFRSSTTFRGARFEAEPPRFYGAALHEDTDWTDIAWPGRPTGRDDAIEFRRAYERLKLLMADQNKFADEHFFLRRELECREVEEPGSLRTLASRAFGLLSDYGWSVERPLSALGIVWLTGAVLLFLGEWADFWLGSWPEPEVQPPEFLGLGQAAALSFSNLFAFLGLGGHIMRDELGSLTVVSEVVAVLQMVAGPILLFLLALGLRNRFRIR